MTEPSYAALRAHQRCTTNLLADPEVTGDLLLVGMWLARAVHLRQPDQAGGEWRTAAIAQDLFPLAQKPAMFMHGEWDQGQETAPNVWKVHETLKADIRRYDWRADQPGPAWAHTPCAGPMVRRERCGKRAQTWALLTDPQTGRMRDLGSCRQHADWWQQQVAANRRECAGVEVPRPAANAGGRLARHVDIDWPALWVALDPKWVAPPEVDSWVRPALRLVVTEVPKPAWLDGLPPAPRPKFALIDGARS